MHTGKQKQINAPYQSSLVNRHIRRFTGKYHLLCFMTIIEFKVMSGHQVKKVKQNNFVI